ncbi:isoleucine--tRNA ligase [Thermoleophilia bacterium SCSIO 60948]|nr:isoleucine--tRNA ligase [Thermoleophilia bacterium SCSIO 60948]
MPGFSPVDPKVSFPALEEKALERWREQDLFARTQKAREGAPTWSFYEGPPTANGRPGSHHVLSRVFKDVYPRYRSMCGYSVPRKAGWDCHGLPVELEVERELGITSKAEIEEFGIAEFNERCRSSVFRYVDDWRALTERIGQWIDLDDAYFTLDNSYIESVWWSLAKVWHDGRLYRGHRVVPYCPRCGTALSSHEVAQGYEDIVDPSAYVEMPITSVPPSDEIPESPLEPGDRLVAWTTTPWTLLSNAALAVGPEIEYVRVRPAGSERVYVVARALVDRVFAVEPDDEAPEIIASLPGAALVGITYSPPFDYVTDFGERGHTVLPADFVTTEDGTGIVHTALAFGEDDYELGKKFGLTLQNPVRLDGTFDERMGEFAGIGARETNPRVLELLRERELLLRVEDYEHAYPHCWRCGTALLYYAKSSWYVRTTDVRDRMLAENERIGWQPEHIKHGRFGRWLENNQDWALSRERYWGTPLPVWLCESPDCEGEFCAGSIEELRERGGEVPDDLHRPYIDDVELDCSDCGGTMRRVPETIDAWWDSGSMPFAQYHHPFSGDPRFAERFPADFISEAIDQTRGWFYSLLAVSTLVFDQASYRNCVCLGLILDPEGQKMSKSRGNIVDPWQVLERHGADAFRWYYFTSQQPWAGYRFSVETVGESVRQFLLTLWNTYSFWVMYANAEGAGADPVELPETGPDADDPAALLDRWALSRLASLVAEVREHMDGYDATQAGRAIAAYVDELSNWYVRLSRRRFWAGDAAALATLRHCLIEVSKLLAPLTPFVSDEIYRNLVGGADGDFAGVPDSVHLADFPEVAEAHRDPELERDVEAVRQTVELGRAARARGKMKMRQPLARAIVVATGDERAAIERMAGLVEAELNVKRVEFVSEEADLVSHAVKPNFRALGPRFGAKMPEVKAAIEALDPDHAAEAIRGERRIAIAIDGRDHPLEPGDMTLAMQPLEGYEVESEAGHAVALELELSDELLREGLAREIVHAVQGARKDAGLEITDRISLSLGGDAGLLEASREYEGYVAGETLATSVDYGGSDGRATKVDGRELLIAVSAAG